MSSFPKRAILPCEIKAREFDSKLLLACFLAERGWTSIVGSRNDIHLKLHRFPRSVYLGKDVRFSSATIVRILRLLGHCFLAMDEEALIFLSRERYRKARVDDDVLSHAEALFAWGPENALAWREAKTHRGQPVHLTGNGRIDLLRPEMRSLYAKQSGELKARHGDFILVNTNFGAINHFMENMSAKVSADDGKTVVRGQENGYLLHRQKVFQAFAEMLPILAKRFPEHKIILRPHPSENHDSWRAITKDCPNLEINNHGNVVPWLLASQALVHNGCTTGLEAYILGRAAITYMPVTSQEFDLHVPNDLSLKAATHAELFDVLEQVIDGRLKASDIQNLERKAVLENYVSASHGPLASQRIANLFDQFVLQKSGRSSNTALWPIGAAVALGRAALKRVHKNRPGHKSNVVYTRHRFPHTEQREVQARVADFSNCLGRFSNVKVRADSDNVFVVTSV